MLDRMPDRTFVFAVIALILSIAAFGYVALFPSVEITEIGSEGELTVRRMGLAAADGIAGLIFALIPVLITLGAILSVPPNGESERRHKLNLIIGTVLLWGYILVVQTIGIFYVPASTLLTSVVVLMLVRDRAWGKPGAEERTKTAGELREEAVRRANRAGNRVGRRRNARRRSR